MKRSEIQDRLLDLFATNPIVLWTDPERQFVEMLADLELPGVTVAIDRDGERFELKALANGLAHGEKLLIYRSNPEEQVSETPDWLADVIGYAPVFSADAISVQLEELNACDTPEMRAMLEQCSPYLNRASGMKRVRARSTRFDNPQELALAVMAAALNAEVPPTADWILCAFIQRADADGSAAACEKLRRAGVLETFARMLGDYVGFHGIPERDGALGAHVLLASLGTIVHLPVTEEVSSLDSACKRQADSVVRLWLQLAQGNEDTRIALSHAADVAETLLDIDTLLRACSIQELAHIDAFPKANKHLAARTFGLLLSGESINDELRSTLDQRNASVWRERYRTLFNVLKAAIDIVRFQEERRTGLLGFTEQATHARAVWQAYTTDWFRMDALYREFYTAWRPAINEHPHFEDELRKTADRIEGIYRRWYLRETSRIWERCACPELASSGYVREVPRQSDFFLTDVEPYIRKKRRIWIIISDALRYEVAAALAENLERTTQGQTSLSSMQAGFPSITACGMAALLPHASLVIAPHAGDSVSPSGLDAYVDNMPTQGTVARGNALQCYLNTYYAGTTGLALQASAFSKLDRAQRKEAVRDASVVYLYHNRIDAIGDEAATEDDVFDACTDTIDELTHLVKLLVREFRASDVLITADHGFQYTAQPLAETDKVPLADVQGHIAAYGKRYVVGNGGLSSNSLVPVDLSSVSNGALTGLAPRECIRIKKPGGGENYVHGGISLQEVCVPVIRFKNYRAGSKGFTAHSHATISLVSQLTMITNFSFGLDVLQNEPVGNKVLPTTYELQIVGPEGEPITRSQRIIADNPDPEAINRVVHVEFRVREGRVLAKDLRCKLVARNVDNSTQDDTVLAEPVLRIAYTEPHTPTW